MKRLVVWSKEATADLDEHIAYIAWDDEAAAERTYTHINDAAENLGLSPIGRLGHRSGTYEKVVTGTPYIIVYTLPNDAPIVNIAHVFHGAQIWWGDH